jgi:protease IV
MKTIWKIAITLTVFALFLFAAVGTLALIGQISIPTIGYTVAVIPVRGEITSDACGGSLLGGVTQCATVSEVTAQLQAAEDDPLVKAIVLDIDSGGGGVVASGNMMRAVKNTNKPVVAYIGESGASGAYYVASASDWIIADRNAITGSIGVIMTVQHYYGLYDKLGINVTVIKSGNSKDIGSPYRPMTDKEKEELTDMVDNIYRDFIWNVAINRGMEVAEVEKLADGSIYLGATAEENGLIDETGSIDDAINKAAQLGNITGEPVVRWEESTQETGILDLFTKYEGLI